MPGETPVEQSLQRARDAFARGAYLAALADLEPLAGSHPHFADVQNLMGLCLSLTGRTEDALDAFERAVELNPGYVEAQLNRAITLNDLGRTGEAQVAFAQAAEADEAKTGGGRFPSAVAARLANRHAELGDLYAEAGAAEEAEAEYRRAVALRPQFLDIRTRLGRVLIELGRTDDAVAELSAVVQARPSFASARAELGLAHFRAGRRGQAEAEWRRALELAPANAQLRSYLGMVQRLRAGEGA